jgi:hypothetical protein
MTAAINAYKILLIKADYKILLGTPNTDETVILKWI